MIDSSTIIRKGQRLWYYRQPEVKPIEVIAVKRKKRGLCTVKCIESGKTKIIEYSLEKLDIMDAYDNYKLESSPECEEKFADIFTFTITKDNVSLDVDVSYDYITDGTDAPPVIVLSSISIAGMTARYKTRICTLSINMTTLLLHIFDESNVIDCLQHKIDEQFLTNKMVD